MVKYFLASGLSQFYSGSGNSYNEYEGYSGGYGGYECGWFCSAPDSGSSGYSGSGGMMGRSADPKPKDR